MSKRLVLQVEDSSVEFLVNRVLVAGYTGRDAGRVRDHIAELERQGIPAPETTPTLYPIDASWATVETEVIVRSRWVSGEAEPALLFCGNDLDDALISVIVDFTDREEERRSVARSKILPKPLSARAWKYSDVAGVWDEIMLRSWVEPGVTQPLYQSGKLGELLSPRDLLARLSLGSNLTGTVLLMGTLPLCSKEFRFSDYFVCELETPHHQKLFCECRLRHQDAGRQYGQ